jgi:hypothetical protein
MQRQQNDNQLIGYHSIRELRFNHFATGVETLLPAYLLARIALGNVSADLDEEMPVFLLAAFSMFRMAMRHRLDYSVNSQSEIESDLVGMTRPSSVARTRAALFASSEDIRWQHHKTRIGVGMIVASITMLSIIDPSTLTRSEEVGAGIMVRILMIAAYEMLSRAYASNYGAQLVEMEAPLDQVAGLRR